MFQSGPCFVFILQRLYAWGTICAMYGSSGERLDSVAVGSKEGDGSSGGKPKTSAYVRWVLSRGQRVQGISSEAHGDMVDRMTGAKRTEDQEAHDFFGELYEMSTWRRQPSAGSSASAAAGTPPMRPSDMLRRLGLASDQAPNLTKTLGVIVDTLNKLRAAKASQAQLKAETGSMYGLRSEPPPVPAPPTLAPEPLMLSPLPELPYLFALEAPEATGLLAGVGVGSSGVQNRRTKWLGHAQREGNARVRQRLWGHFVATKTYIGLLICLVLLDSMDLHPH